MKVVLTIVLFVVFFFVFMAGASLGVEHGAPVVHSAIYGD